MSVLLDPYFYAYNPELLAFENAWVNFIKKGHINYSIIKPDVADSWLRCKNRGLDPIETRNLPLLPKEEIAERLKSNAKLMKTVEPFMESIFDIVRGSGFVIDFVDADGYILKSLYDEEAYELSKKSNSLPGANRLEETAGTSGIALAFITKKPIQVAGAEHYLQELHRWTCSAAPVLNKEEEVLCVLSVSGRYEMIHLHTLGMVAACANAIQNELQIQEINNEIIKNNNQLQATFDMISEGLLYLSEKNIIQLNNNMCEMIGESEESLLGKPYAECIKTIPEFETLMSNDATERKNVKVTLICKQKKISCFMDIKPIFGARNQEIGRVVIFRKTNEIKALANKIPYQTRYTFENILGSNESLKEVIKVAKKAAEHNVRIVIEGESGTGKEMFAQAIHNLSDRKESPFVALDCGALPIELLESNLFGYEGGAFTGAKKEGQAGVFEIANGGTVFMDEVENMAIEMQQKLLRVLQENVVMRVGSSKQIPFDVRIITATNSSLEEKVKEGTFREDLYYRLNVINIKIPSLKDRREDIPVLIDYYLSKDTPITKKKQMSAEALSRMVSYDWPGNVRQLVNAIEYAKIMTKGQMIEVSNLPSFIFEKNEENHYENRYVETAFDETMTLKEMNRKYVSKIVNDNGNNVSKAAKILGISRATVYKMMKGEE